MKHAIAIAALVVTTAGTLALPVAARDTIRLDAAAQTVAGQADRAFHRMMPRGAGPAGGPILRLVCSDRGAEALENAFTRLARRLDLTGEQQAPFDTLRTDALTAQTAFADSCAKARPAAGAATADPVARLKARLAIEQARLDAMTRLLPDLEAFYASLTDAQRADLLPRHGFGRNPDARTAPGRAGRAPAPGRG